MSASRNVMNTRTSTWVVVVGAVAFHHMLDADHLVGDRVDLAGQHEVLAQRERVQILISHRPIHLPHQPARMKCSASRWW